MNQIACEPTLLEAVSRYIQTLGHPRGRLAQLYRVALARFAAQWILEGHPNRLSAVSAQWLEDYLETLPGRQPAREALRDFYRWAIHEGLAEFMPLADDLDLLEEWREQLAGNED